MSRAAKITLGAAVLGSAFTIWAVHHLQNQERFTMYQGVLRDEERRKEKRKQREEDLEQSLQRREIYERVQTVSSPAPAPVNPPST